MLVVCRMWVGVKCMGNRGMDRRYIGKGYRDFVYINFCRRY